MKKYTKKQIAEAIAYWEKQLGKMNESGDGLSDKEIKDQVERVMEKVSDEFNSGDRDEFDRWYTEAEDWVKDGIRDGLTFDELVKGAV